MHGESRSHGPFVNHIKTRVPAIRYLFIPSPNKYVYKSSKQYIDNRNKLSHIVARHPHPTRSIEAPLFSMEKKKKNSAPREHDNPPVILRARSRGRRSSSSSSQRISRALNPEPGAAAAARAILHPAAGARAPFNKNKRINTPRGHESQLIPGPRNYPGRGRIFRARVHINRRARGRD